MSFGAVTENKDKTHKIKENDLMPLYSKLGKIYIHGLFDQYNIQFDLSKRCNVLVGENGIGKTTILKIIDFIFEGDFAALTRYPFEKIVLESMDKGKIGSATINYCDLFPNFNFVLQRIQERFGPEISEEELHKFGITEADSQEKVLEKFIEGCEGDYTVKNELGFLSVTLMFLAKLKKDGLLNKYYSNIYNKRKHPTVIDVLQKNTFILSKLHQLDKAIIIFDNYIMSTEQL